MTKTLHRIYISSMVIITVVVTLYLLYTGYAYYELPKEERFYHPRHDWFKPSGTLGHGLGIVGTLMILFGVAIYIARKRYNFLVKIIRLKYLLEFHIFLCVLGPILIVFHTAFKFGGVVSVAFWSMIAVVFSGVIGRFIYIQIPRTIEGRALSLDEVLRMKNNLLQELVQTPGVSAASMDLIIKLTSGNTPDNSEQSWFHTYMNNQKTIQSVSQILERNTKDERTKIISLVRKELSLSSKIKRLHLMQRLFKYWHVAHLPFALIMLIIVVIHVSVTLAFGYKWIF